MFELNRLKLPLVFFFFKLYTSLALMSLREKILIDSSYCNGLHQKGCGVQMSSGPMLSISRNVHMFVCLFVCLSFCLFVCSLLRYQLTVFLPPLPEVGCPIFLEIRNPWGKVMERTGLRFEHFCLEVV